MKTYFSIVFLISALFFACSTSDKKVSPDAVNDTKKDSGVVDTSTVKVLKEYFSNGKIKTETAAKGNLRHGLTKNYDRDGHLLSQVTYVNNTREGIATNFYPLSGKVNSTLVYKKGIKDGDETWYYESGQPYRVTPYIKGFANGIQKFYYEDGKLKAEVPIKNGNPGTGLKEYKTDGTLIAGYPALIIRQKDFMATAGKVVLNIELSDPKAQVKFYRGSLEDGKYISDNMNEMSVRNGIASIDFNVPPGSAVNQKVIISANIKTAFGNPLIVSRTFNVSAVNNH
jgi:antitoxin component YwqK of YwqJK toxin-antitoxin module